MLKRSLIFLLLTFCIQSHAEDLKEILESRLRAVEIRMLTSLIDFKRVVETSDPSFHHVGQAEFYIGQLERELKSFDLLGQELEDETLKGFENRKDYYVLRIVACEHTAKSFELLYEAEVDTVRSKVMFKEAIKHYSQ